MSREPPPASGPPGADDLPPLPSKHYRARPRFSCPDCRRHFLRAEELDAHRQQEHAEEPAQGSRNRG